MMADEVGRAREALRSLIYGYQRTQLLHAAAVLRLADHLAAAPLALEGLAARVGVAGDTLKRLVNGLIGTGVIAEDDGRYRLTQLGEGLREDVPGSLASLAVLSGEEYYRAWLGFDPLVEDGTTPFARFHGAPVFDWYRTHATEGARFNRRMATRIAAFAPAVASAVDLSHVLRIVDIGGGLGILLDAFLRRWPEARGVLFDLPAAATAGEARLAGMDIAARIEVVGGDFFQEVPAGGDVYLLSQILHDWNDEQCRVILGNIRRAMAPDGKLLVIELLMPERVSGPDPVVDVDLVMLVLTGGRERTVNEYRELLSRSGFALEQVLAAVAPGGISVLVAHAE